MHLGNEAVLRRKWGTCGRIADSVFHCGLPHEVVNYPATYFNGRFRPFHIDDDANQASATMPRFADEAAFLSKIQSLNRNLLHCQ